MRNGYTADRLYRSFWVPGVDGLQNSVDIRYPPVYRHDVQNSKQPFLVRVPVYVDLAIRERLCVYTSSNSSNTAAMRGRRRPASTTVYRAAARNPPS